MFGVSSGQGGGGLGWFVNDQQYEMRAQGVFAGLLTVMLFGLFVDNVIFTSIESKTVRRCGMQT